jgi:hypothetical protein
MSLLQKLTVAVTALSLISRRRFYSEDAMRGAPATAKVIEIFAPSVYGKPL